MKKVLTVCLLILTAGCIISQNKELKKNVLWETDCINFMKAGWALQNLSATLTENAIRLQAGEGAEGRMSCEIKYPPSAKFIQIKAGASEHAENSFYLAYDDVRYKMFQGWNTFPLNQKNPGTYNIVIIQSPGGWADIEKIRVVEKPLDGLTVELLDGTSTGNTARVGDRVAFRYFPSSEISEKELKLDCFIVPKMSEFRFSGEPLILKKMDDSSYSCSVKIDKDAYSFKSGKDKYVLASIMYENIFSHTYAFSNIDIKTGNSAPDSIFTGANPDTIKYRRNWMACIRGNNLAAGKDFIFSQQPDYRLSAKGAEAAKALTDGKLSTQKNDAIWFDSAAVGWYEDAKRGFFGVVDLGEPKPVGDVVIRALSGKVQSGLIAPAEFRIFVSKDNRNFYEASGMVKVTENEKDLSNFKTHYYLEETGKAYAYPFRLEVNAAARYVLVYFKGAGSVFIDEVAVMEGSPDQHGFNKAYDGKAQTFVTSGILVEPRFKELAISTNIDTPNTLQISDMRDKKTWDRKVTIIIEVPEGINIISPDLKRKDIEIGGHGYTRWELPYRRIEASQSAMFFLKADAAAKINLPAYTYAECEGIVPERIEVPVRLFEIPEVKPKLKRIHVSLAWMKIEEQIKYPEFFKAWNVLGFNAIGCFPRNWKKAEYRDKMQKYLDAARKEGFAIVMDESPYHMMKKDAEVFSQYKGKHGSGLCPSYNGKYYEMELERVAGNTKLVKPDYVFWDIECWYQGAKEAPSCTRCVDAQLKSGKSMDDFLKDCGTEKIKGLHDAVKKGMGGGKMPLISTYATHPAVSDYSGILDFNRFYPAYADVAANSLYTGNPQRIHDAVRRNYMLMKAKKTIPWLTTGCYGEFEPYKIEQNILEALLNGACGITYFQYSHFDTPLDFYYHARALSEIAPYEDLIMDGEILTALEGSNKALTYSAIKKGNEMLLLIGNYTKNAEGMTEVRLPFDNVIEIKDLRDGGTRITPGNNLKINVPEEQIVLYYVKGN